MKLRGCLVQPHANTTPRGPLGHLRRCVSRKTKHEKVLFLAENSKKKHPPTSVGVFFVFLVPLELKLDLRQGGPLKKMTKVMYICCSAIKKSSYLLYFIFIFIFIFLIDLF
jgi:hypothetical protein